jgi:hypothetical protein
MVISERLRFDYHWEVWEDPTGAHGQHQAQRHWGPSGQ